MKSGLCKYCQPLRLEKPSNFRLALVACASNRFSRKLAAMQYRRGISAKLCSARQNSVLRVSGLPSPRPWNVCGPRGRAKRCSVGGEISGFRPALWSLPGWPSDCCDLRLGYCRLIRQSIRKFSADSLPQPLYLGHLQFSLIFSGLVHFEESCI